MNQHTKSFDEERKFVLLGVLLQALHVLFGVTALLGMYLTLGRLPSIKHALWREQCKWQVTTFWVGAALYISTIIIGFLTEQWWPFVLAAMWVTYRILCSAIGVATRSNIHRWI